MTDRPEPAFIGMYWTGAGLPFEARLVVPAADVPELRAGIIAAVEHSPSVATLRTALRAAADAHGLELEFSIDESGQGPIATATLHPSQVGPSEPVVTRPAGPTAPPRPTQAPEPAETPESPASPIASR